VQFALQRPRERLLGLAAWVPRRSAIKDAGRSTSTIAPPVTSNCSATRARSTAASSLAASEHAPLHSRSRSAGPGTGK
jgi:hypothetical protein